MRVSCSICFAAPAPIDELIRAGKIIPETNDGSRPLRHRRCVRAGASKPDVSSVDAFTRALIAARSIAYLKEAQSASTWPCPRVPSIRRRRLPCSRHPSLRLHLDVEATGAWRMMRVNLAGGANTSRRSRLEIQCRLVDDTISVIDISRGAVVSACERMNRCSG